jgi:hypothetical protein
VFVSIRCLKQNSHNGGFSQGSLNTPRAEFVLWCTLKYSNDGTDGPGDLRQTQFSQVRILDVGSDGYADCYGGGNNSFRYL